MRNLGIGSSSVQVRDVAIAAAAFAFVGFLLLALGIAGFVTGNRGIGWVFGGVGFLVEAIAALYYAISHSLHRGLAGKVSRLAWRSLFPKGSDWPKGDGGEIGPEE